MTGSTRTGASIDPPAVESYSTVTLTHKEDDHHGPNCTHDPHRGDRASVTVRKWLAEVD
jgi:hypothetical protein